MKINLIIVAVVLMILPVFGEPIIKISEDLELNQISGHCYIHTSYHDLENAPRFPANGLVYVNLGKAFIVDTPWTNELTELLIKYLQDSLKVSVEAVIPTHWHTDCMGGLAIVHNMGIKSYAYQLTAAISKEKNLPIPQVIFSDSLKLGPENELLLKYLGPGHTEDNMVVHIPSEKILFAGCMVKVLGWNSLGFTGDANIPEWPKTLRKVLIAFRDVKIVIPGHGNYGGLDILEHTLSLFK